MPTSNEVGVRLEVLRKRAKLTQAQLAKLVGVTPAAINNYESGLRIPKDPHKKRLAQVLGESIEAIFFS